MSSSVPRTSCAWAQSGAQSAEQPISEFRSPGTLTFAGWTTLSFPPEIGPVGAGSPTTAQVPVADRWPELSFNTARYSTRAPLARPVTSWNTRYGALSSVPSGRQSVVPTGRQAKLTWLNPPAGAATPTSARPPTVAPAAARNVMDGADLVRCRVPSARHT